MNDIRMNVYVQYIYMLCFVWWLHKATAFNYCLLLNIEINFLEIILLENFSNPPPPPVSWWCWCYLIFSFPCIIVCSFVLGHTIVCHSHDFWLPYWYLQSFIPVTYIPCKSNMRLQSLSLSHAPSRSLSLKKQLSLLD